MSENPWEFDTRDQAAYDIGYNQAIEDAIEECRLDQLRVGTSVGIIADWELEALRKKVSE